MGPKGDGLWDVLVAREVLRNCDNLLLERIGPSGPLRPRVLIRRAKASNLLGGFAAGLLRMPTPPCRHRTHRHGRHHHHHTLARRGISAEDLAAAHGARGVALAGLGRMQDAQAAFPGPACRQRRRLAQLLAQCHALHARRLPGLESALRDAPPTPVAGPQLHLIWLCLASERQQPGRGKQALRDEAERSDASQWSGALMRHLASLIDREALLQMARAKPEMERLRLAEACATTSASRPRWPASADAWPGSRQAWPPRPCPTES